MSTIFVSTIRPQVFSVNRPVIIYRRGGGGGFKATQGEILPIPPFNITSLKWSPLKTFDDFHDPPHVSSFSKQIWAVPRLNPSKVIIDPPFWVLSYDWSPLLFSQKSSDPPVKSSTSKAIDND